MGDIIQFSVGKNPTRSNVDASKRYSPEDLENDLLRPDVYKNICMINMINSKAAPLSKENAGKFFTSNFLKCELDISVINAWYFCYQFNEGTSLKEQITKYNQGTTLSVRKLTRGLISELEISLPDLKKQEIIGEIYRNSLIQHALMLKQAENMNELTLAIIRKIEND